MHRKQVIITSLSLSHAQLNLHGTGNNGTPREMALVLKRQDLVKALDSQIFLSTLQNAKPAKTGGRNLGSVVDGVLHVGMY